MLDLKNLGVSIEDTRIDADAEEEAEVDFILDTLDQDYLSHVITPETYLTICDILYPISQRLPQLIMDLRKGKFR